MTRSNRLLNRLILVVLGVGLLAIAAWLTLRLQPAWSPWELPAIPAPTDVAAMVIVAAGAAVVALLALLWAFSRGRGRVTAIRDEGGLVIDARLPSDLLGASLADCVDISSVHTRAFRIRGTRVLSVSVTPVAGADLARMSRALRSAIADLDAQLEYRIPVSVHVASGVRVFRAHERRVD